MLRKLQPTEDTLDDRLNAKYNDEADILVQAPSPKPQLPFTRFSCQVPIIAILCLLDSEYHARASQALASVVVYRIQANSIC